MVFQTFAQKFKLFCTLKIKINELQVGKVVNASLGDFIPRLVKASTKFLATRHLSNNCKLNIGLTALAQARKMVAVNL